MLRRVVVVVDGADGPKWHLRHGIGRLARLLGKPICCFDAEHSEDVVCSLLETIKNPKLIFFRIGRG